MAIKGGAGAPGLSVSGASCRCGSNFTFPGALTWTWALMNLTMIHSSFSGWNTRRLSAAECLHGHNGTGTVDPFLLAQIHWSELNNNGSHQLFWLKKNYSQANYSNCQRSRPDEEVKQWLTENTTLKFSHLRRTLIPLHRQVAQPERTVSGIVSHWGWNTAVLVNSWPAHRHPPACHSQPNTSCCIAPSIQEKERGRRE